jgi:hypothetical protein
MQQQPRYDDAAAAAADVDDGDNDYVDDGMVMMGVSTALQWVTRQFKHCDDDDNCIAVEEACPLSIERLLSGSSVHSGYEALKNTGDPSKTQLVLDQPVSMSDFAALVRNNDSSDVGVGYIGHRATDIGGVLLGVVQEVRHVPLWQRHLRRGWCTG